MSKNLQALIKQMTLEEKAGQLNQLGPSLVGTFGVSFDELLNMMFDGRITKAKFEEYMRSAEQDFHEKEIREGGVGSINGALGVEAVLRLQKIAVEESRLGIPLLFGYDVIHGLRTVCPIPLAESCSWNPEIYEKTARIAAVESAEYGLNWTFAPMLDVARDARWGRVSEGAGEDPYLTSVFARAKVRGFQSDDLRNGDVLLACAKHFLAYSASQSGRDYNVADISEETLRDVFLPPFAAAVSAGVGSVMPAFTAVRGEPMSASKHYLRGLLQIELGFDGLVISDSNAIAELQNHGVASDRADASRLALEAGIHMDMSSSCYAENLAALVREGKVSEEMLDQAVLHVLKAKEMLGLFDNPYAFAESKEAHTLCPAFRETALEAARESIVLLKNDGILPLKPQERVVLVGALADDGDAMLGAWAIAGKGADCVTVKAALSSRISLVYLPVCGVDSPIDEEQLAQITPDDTVIAVIGESAEMSGEAASRANLNVPGKQEEMVKRLISRGCKVIIVLINGRPLTIPWLAENASAIVEAWQLGVEAGNAAADVLLGNFNPCGRLTMSFPRVVGQCPITYNEYATGRPAGKSKYTSKYLDVPADALYPFGYGLSYTTFEYSAPTAEASDNTLHVTCSVENTGNRTGTTVAQLYIRDVLARRVRPVRELKAFERVTLAPGERLEIMFRVPFDALAYTVDGQTAFEPGEFMIYTGENARDALGVLLRI